MDHAVRRAKGLPHHLRRGGSGSGWAGEQCVIKQRKRCFMPCGCGEHDIHDLCVVAPRCSEQ
eukprot:10629488-Lingulodinium_polyedra.AAC.1